MTKGCYCKFLPAKGIYRVEWREPESPAEEGAAIEVGDTDMLMMIRAIIEHVVCVDIGLPEDLGKKRAFLIIKQDGRRTLVKMETNDHSL